MIARNVENIRGQIAETCKKSGRNASEIRLIGVTKTVAPDSIRELVRCGITDLGENYVQDLREKKELLADLPVRWHFIGHLQSNKVKYLSEWIHLVHAVDTAALASEISRQAGKHGRKADILIEINTSGESSKFGVKEDEAPALVREISDLKNISVRGLMTMGPLGEDPEDSRDCFRRLRQMSDFLRGEGYDMPDLSMGMTNDFRVAIEEGATMLRIGTAIFGGRS